MAFVCVKAREMKHRDANVIDDVILEGPTEATLQRQTLTLMFLRIRKNKEVRDLLPWLLTSDDFHSFPESSLVTYIWSLYSEELFVLFVTIRLSAPFLFQNVFEGGPVGLQDDLNHTESFCMHKKNVGDVKQLKYELKRVHSSSEGLKLSHQSCF